MCKYALTYVLTYTMLLASVQGCKRKNKLRAKFPICCTVLMDTMQALQGSSGCYLTCITFKKERVKGSESNCLQCISTAVKKTKQNTECLYLQSLNVNLSVKVKA